MTERRPVPLKRVVLDACDGPFGSSLKSDHYRDDGARVIRLGNVGAGSWVDSDAAYIDLDYWRLLNRHHALPGDLIVAGLGDENHPVGRACVLPDVGPAMVKADCYRLRLDPARADARFVALFLSSTAGSGEALKLADGATRSRLTLSKALSIPIPDLDLELQRAIVDYLDAETARIDRLIAGTASTASLLRERHQAEVAVRFLPQELPGGWVMMKLKRIATFKSGDSITSDFIEAEGQYPVFGGNGVRGFTDRYNCDGFYPLVGRQGALCGNVNYGQGRFWASEHAVVVRPHTGVEAMWLGELLRALDLNQYSLTAAQPGLAVDQVENLVVPVPGQSRQRELAGWVSGQTAWTDMIARALQARLILLQERRQALITAAVTGQIEIPGVAA